MRIKEITIILALLDYKRNLVKKILRRKWRNFTKENNFFMKSLDTLKILRCPKWYLESKNIPNFFMSFAQYSLDLINLFFSKTHEDFFSVNTFNQ